MDLIWIKKLFVFLLVLLNLFWKSQFYKKSADNTNAEIILPLSYLIKTVKVEKCFMYA